MKNNKNMISHSDLMEGLDIGVCFYPPQENKHGYSEYDGGFFSYSEPITAKNTHDFHSTYDMLLNHLSTSELAEWQVILNQQLKYENSEKELLDALVQVILERGQEMLPFLKLLKTKSDQNPRLKDLVTTLEKNLDTGLTGYVSLAPREMEVLAYVAKGLGNSDIAEILSLQTVTVTKTLSRAYRKLNAKNRSEAVQKWMLLLGA